MKVSVEDFERQQECVYKNEHYSARDNGAVFRHARENKILRKNDNIWSFGIPNERSYLCISSEVVHRIVAYAFLGAPPSPQHVVDHIDTNRKNNRPDNLRWLTKLENILNNPITVKKIVYRCGSIEAFLEDPSILRKYESEDKNFSWMRTVTAEEAKISWKRLSEWAGKEMNSKPTGLKLGEWIYQDNRIISNFDWANVITNAVTPNAQQENWSAPHEFPNCPQTFTGQPIDNYLSKLTIGEIFSRNENSSTIIKEIRVNRERDSIVVLAKDNRENLSEPWLLVQIIYNGGYFLHTRIGSYAKEIEPHEFLKLAQELSWK